MSQTLEDRMIKLNKEEFKGNVVEYAKLLYCKNIDEANNQQLFQNLCVYQSHHYVRSTGKVAN